MDWKASLTSFRKTLDAHLRGQGFKYLRQNSWERPLGKWRASFSVESFPKKKGEQRQLLVWVMLIRSEVLTPEQARSEGPLAANPNSTAYAVYSFTFPGLGGLPDENLIEYLATAPEQLSTYAGEITQLLDSVWLPWLIARSLEEDTSERAYRRIEMVDKRIDYVP